MTAVKFVALAALATLLSIQEDPNLGIRLCAAVSLTLMLWQALEMVHDRAR